LLQKGIIAAGRERKADLASAYFLAARLSARMLLRSLNAIGISDGEIAAIPARAANAWKSLLDGDG